MRDAVELGLGPATCPVYFGHRFETAIGTVRQGEPGDGVSELNNDEVPVRLEPLGMTVPVRRGQETLMHAARRAGLRWPTVCHGSGICSVCFVRVLETDEPLPTVSAGEAHTLRRLPP